MVSEFLAGRTSIPGSGSTLGKLAYRSVIDLVETSVATNANPRLVGAAAPPLFQLLSVLCSLPLVLHLLHFHRILTRSRTRLFLITRAKPALVRPTRIRGQDPCRHQYNADARPAQS